MLELYYIYLPSTAKQREREREMLCKITFHFAYERIGFRTLARLEKQSPGFNDEALSRITPRSGFIVILAERTPLVPTCLGVCPEI